LELKIAVTNFGPEDTGADGTDRWGAAMRWDTTISMLRAWQPHIVLGQEISASAPGGLRAHLWLTANTLGMVPVLGPPSPGSAAGNHPAVLVSTDAGLVIEDAAPAWPFSDGTQPAWCEVLVRAPGWAQPVRAYSVDLPWRSSVEQLSQADRLATRIAELAGAGELAIAGGNWNSYGRADPVMPAALEAAPLHLRPSRMRYSPRDQTLTPNYDVHDVLTSVSMDDAATVAPMSGDPEGTSVSGRVDRIYLARDLAGAATRYVQQEVPDSEHRAVMLTLDGTAARSVTQLPSRHGLPYGRLTRRTRPAVVPFQRVNQPSPTGHGGRTCRTSTSPTPRCKPPPGSCRPGSRPSRAT